MQQRRRGCGTLAQEKSRYEATPKMSSRPFIQIAMHNLGRITARGEPPSHLFRQQNRAMPATGAAEGNGQITLSLTDVMGDQVSQQAFDAPQEFACLRERPDITRYFGIASREFPPRREKMGIGQKTAVQSQVNIRGDAISISKTHHRNHQRPLGAALKSIDDELPQLVDIEFGGVDDHVREPANRVHQRPLTPQPLAHRTIVSQRMWAPRLAESAQQSIFRSLDEYQTGGHFAADLFVKSRQAFELIALSRVDHESRAFHFRIAVKIQLAEGRNQVDGQVIDAIIAQVLKRLQNRALPRAA